MVTMSFVGGGKHTLADDVICHILRFASEKVLQSARDVSNDIELSDRNLKVSCFQKIQTAQNDQDGPHLCNSINRSVPLYGGFQHSFYFVVLAFVYQERVNFRQLRQ